MKGAAVQRRDVEAFVRRKLDGLLRLGDGARRAALANLRRGAGRAPGICPASGGRYSTECRRIWPGAARRRAVLNGPCILRLRSTHYTSRGATRRANL